MPDPIRTEIQLDTSSADAIAAQLGARLDEILEEPRDLEIEPDLSGVEALQAELDAIRDDVVDVRTEFGLDGLADLEAGIAAVDDSTVAVDAEVTGTDQVEALGEAGAESAVDLSKLGDAADDVTGKIVSSLGPIGSYVGQLASLAGPAGIAVAAGAALAYLGDRIETVRREIAFDTGDLGPDLQANLDLTLDTVARVGSEFATTGTIVAQLDSRFADLGETARAELAEDLAILSTVAIGAGFSVADLRDVIAQIGEDPNNAREVLSLLTQGAQEYDLSIANLAQNVARNAPILNILGLTLEEQIDLIGQFDRASVDFNRITRTLATALQDAAEAGQDPKQVFIDLLTGVQDFARAGDNQAALALLKDYGVTGFASVEILNALGTAAADLDLSNLGTQLDRNIDRLQQFQAETETTGDKLRQTWGEFIEEIAPAAVGAIEGITEAVRVVGATVEAEQSSIDKFRDFLFASPSDAKSFLGDVGGFLTASPSDFFSGNFFGDDIEEEAEILQSVLDATEARYRQFRAEVEAPIQPDFTGTEAQLAALDQQFAEFTLTVLGSSGSLPQLGGQLRDLVSESEIVRNALRATGLTVDGLVSALTGTDDDWNRFVAGAEAAAVAAGTDAAGGAAALIGRLGPLRSALLATASTALTLGQAFDLAFDTTFGLAGAQRDASVAMGRVNSLLEGQASAGGGAARSAEDLTKATEAVTRAQTELAEAEENLTRVRTGVGFGDPTAVEAGQRVGDLRLALRAANAALVDAQQRRTDVGTNAGEIKSDIASTEAELAAARADSESSAAELAKIEDKLGKLRKQQAQLPQDLEKAEIGLAQAQNRVRDATDDLNDATDEWTQIAKGAEEGSESLTDAQDAVETATLRLRDAQDALTQSTSAGGGASAAAAVDADTLEAALDAAAETMGKAALKALGLRSETDLTKESFFDWRDELDRLEETLDPQGLLRTRLDDLEATFARLAGLRVLSTGRTVSVADIIADVDPRIGVGREGLTVGPGHGGPRLIYAGEGAMPEALVGAEHPTGVILSRLASVGVLDKILAASGVGAGGSSISETIVVERGAVSFHGPVDRAAVAGTVSTMVEGLAAYTAGRRARLRRRVQGRR